MKAGARGRLDIWLLLFFDGLHLSLACTNELEIIQCGSRTKWVEHDRCRCNQTWRVAAMVTCSCGMATSTCRVRYHLLRAPAEHVWPAANAQQRWHPLHPSHQQLVMACASSKVML